MSVATVSRPIKHAFEQRVDAVKPSKNDLNFVIMDYLVNEGYPAAAKKFAAEANIPHPAGDYENIEDRVEIRNAIISGDIQTAIEKINELNPSLLDLDESLHFALLRLQLIELIRKSNSTPDGDIIPAITFAQTQLAPRAPKNPDFLKDLECAMALLIYPPEKLIPSLVGLLEPELKQGIANRVNEAILKGQGYRSQTRLKSLVKLKSWAEKRARDAGHDLPDKLSIWHDSVKPSTNVEDSLMGGTNEAAAMAL